MVKRVWSQFSPVISLIWEAECLRDLGEEATEASGNYFNTTLAHEDISIVNVTG